MRWNTPLSEPHAARLIEQLGTPAGATAVDLGCGWGELLLRIAAPRDVMGIGVDTDADLLARGEALAVQRGLEGCVRFVRSPAQDWHQPAERLVCIGAAHAWGGTAPALRALRQLARPGARMLFGDGCWEAPPTQAAAEIFDDVLALTEIVTHAHAAGWRILHLDTADQREWDEFEAAWRLGREAWLAAHPGDSRADSVRAELDARALEYVRDYRGVLGFCYLVLGAG